MRETRNADEEAAATDATFAATRDMTPFIVPRIAVRVNVVLVFAVAVGIVVADVVDASSIRRHVAVGEQWYRTPGNPGVKIRLTKKGANHLKTVGVKLFNEQISTLQGYALRMPITQAGLNGWVTLTDVRVLHYRPPELSVMNFLPPRSIVLGLENMDVTIAGNFMSSVPPIEVGGQMDGSLVGLTVALTTEFVTSSDGSMAAIVGNCSTIIVRSHFNLHPVGPMGLFVKNLEALINDGIARRIPDLLCNRLKRLIEGQTPRLLRRLTRLDVGKNVAERIVTENPAVNDFISNLVDGLYIDNANVAQPIITDDFLETQNRGEFRYNRQTELSPFFPKPMRITTKSDRMLHFYASDYLFNSMLYHAYQMNNLHMQFSADNLPKEFGSFLSTTCAPRELCIGRMIPPLGKRFPNTTASFVLISHGLPDFKFSNDSAIVQLSMRVLTYVKENGRQRQVIVSSADGDAEVLLSVEGDNLSGELKLRTLDVRLHRTAIEGIHSQSFAQLAPLAKTFIGPHLSDALKRGIPFPLKDMMKLVEPKVRRHEGFIELSTDFQLNESAFRKTVRETFADVNV